MKNTEGKKKRAIFCFFLLWAGFAMTAFGQPGDPGTNPDVPISGIEWLLIGGGILGAGRFLKRIRKV
jgi:hypothetical protein